MTSDAVMLLAPDPARDDGRPRLILPPQATTETPAGSPLWWLVFGEALLAEQQRRIAKADRYYNGLHDTMFISPKYRDAFGKLLRALVDNWMQIVVDALRERLGVTGFRIPVHTDQPAGQPEVPDPYDLGAGDADAWGIWQYNDLDAESQLAHSEAFIKGLSFAMVSPFVKENERPEITIEDASQMVVIYDGAGRKRPAAAVKIWIDMYGSTLGTVYLPDGIYKYRRATGIETGLVLPSGVRVNSWAPREVDGEDWPLANPLAQVFVVPLENRPRLLSCGESELSQVMSTQDAINKILADLMVASEFAAFPQRTAVGYKPDPDPATGEDRNVFEGALNRVWWMEDPDARFGQFDAADLANYTNAMKMLLESLAARTRLPSQYFGLGGQWPSGDALIAAEAGLVSKATEKMLFFGNSWERVIRLAFKAMGDPRGEVFDSETLWADPQRRSPAIAADASTKLGASGVPWTQRMIDLGYSPQEIQRMRQEILASGAEVPVVMVNQPAGPAKATDAGA